MHSETLPHSQTDHRLRLAGLLYLIIIAAGITSEVALRGPAMTDIAAHLPQLRLSLGLDAVMLGADILLAVVFFTVLKAVNPMLALSAMILRLMQAAIIGATLVLQIAAIHAPEHAPWLMQAQADGYDFGLIFFGLNTLLMANLLCRSGLVPRWLPPMLMASAVVYLIGSFTAILSPAINAMIQPLYLIPLVGESTLCLYLLIRGAGRKLAVA